MTAIEEIKESLQKKYSHVRFLLLLNDVDSVSLSILMVALGERQKGIGSKFLKDLCFWVDQKGYILSVTPDNLGTPVTVLRKWYKSFGFLPNKGKRKDFRTRDSYLRLPRKMGMKSFA